MLKPLKRGGVLFYFFRDVFSDIRDNYEEIVTVDAQISQT